MAKLTSTTASSSPHDTLSTLTNHNNTSPPPLSHHQPTKSQLQQPQLIQQQLPQSHSLNGHNSNTIHLQVATTMMTTVNNSAAILSSALNGTSSSGIHLSKSLAQIGSQTTLNTAASGGGNSIIIDNKDATLIELLKRGTKVAVKRACSDPGQLVLSPTTTVTNPNSSAQQALNAIITASKTQVMSSERNKNGKRDCSESSSDSRPPKAAPLLSASLASDPCPVSSIDSSPSLALTVANQSSSSTVSNTSNNNNNSDVFTLAYNDSSSPYFGENEVYSVNDTAMLLQVC